MQKGNLENKHISKARAKAVAEEQEELRFNQINRNVIYDIAPVSIKFTHTVIHVAAKADPRSPKHSPSTSSIKIEKEDKKQEVVVKESRCSCLGWFANKKNKKHKKDATCIEYQLQVPPNSPRFN